MSSKTQLDRRSVTTRAPQAFTLPDMPKMPGWVVRQFGLSEWEAQMDDWRRNAQEGIRDALGALRSQEPNQPATDP